MGESRSREMMWFCPRHMACNCCYHESKQATLGPKSFPFLNSRNTSVLWYSLSISNWDINYCFQFCLPLKPLSFFMFWITCVHAYSWHTYWVPTVTRGRQFTDMSQCGHYPQQPFSLAKKRQHNGDRQLQSERFDVVFWKQKQNQ